MRYMAIQCTLFSFNALCNKPANLWKYSLQTWTFYHYNQGLLLILPRINSHHISINDSDSSPGGSRHKITCDLEENNHCINYCINIMISLWLELSKEFQKIFTTLTQSVLTPYKINGKIKFKIPYLIIFQLILCSVSVNKTCTYHQTRRESEDCNSVHHLAGFRDKLNLLLNLNLNWSSPIDSGLV